MQQIEEAVAARRPGDGPHDRGDPSLVKQRLVFEVRSETMALFRDLQARVRADLGGAVDDDMLLYEVARRALGGPVDEGRASYQVAVTTCAECGRTSIDAGGESHAVDDVVGEMAACDAQALGGTEQAGGQFPHVGGAAEGRGSAASESRPPRERRGSRASQRIPPAIRRAVIRRDRKRCVVPGCKNHRFLDVHHLDLRSEGGGHDSERLAVLCGAHHRAVHAGVLAIDGTAAAGFVVHHADGTSYGAPASLRRIDVAREVQGALEHLGFKATQARTLIEKALRVVVPSDASVLLRAALRAS